ncbi:MAG: hypothetical protein Q8916_04640 [Bacteroidota bacterium]|nr:hypothetical protein [Bacteroidota bacterium]MDP4237060.1 hypothetical protein [Bacteroidota bacterium]
MSKGGGAGKVYFILYLAVLLELLIIIVERDDAEEELKREKLALEQKSKRIQLIAEAIISALRGSQTSLSSTSDQSMTLGDPKEPEREFSVKVRVSDPAKDVVDSLALTILRNNNVMQTIDIAADSVTYPRVRQGQDYIFKYKFKPSFGEGDYKLAFKAKTNQVVGVAQNAKNDDTVKIGAVRLTVGELKEVKDGITENVALKGFIDSLLGDQYQNFSSNLGENDFIVNVKRAENKFDQIALYPVENDFSAFPGMELPNPIKIEGALSSKTEITKLEGPGEFKKVDTNWVWVFTPSASDVGQNYTVKFKGDAKRGGGPKDITTQQFSVTVKALRPVAGDSGVYSPYDDDAKQATPFTKVHFSINGKYADLNGDYQIKLTLDGADFKTVNEPTYSFTPTFLEMEGKKLGITILFKTQFMRTYTQLKKDEFTIAPPPLNVGGGGTVYVDEKVVKLKAGFGIEGDYSPTSGDLNVQSDGGFFDTKAQKTGDYDFTLRLVKAPPNLKKEGLPVKVTFIDPTSAQKFTKTIKIMKKR